MPSTHDTADDALRVRLSRVHHEIGAHTIRLRQLIRKLQAIHEDDLTPELVTAELERLLAKIPGFDD